MKFTDTVAIAGTRRRDDGYLVADARVARTGIQNYAGYEVGKPDMAIVRVYRPDAEVFSRDTMASFAHRPVTNDHPDVPVTADNWKEHAVGNTADEVARDGHLLRIPLMVSDATAIKDIEDGKRELSAGYSCELDWTSGRTADGKAYDAIQKNIRANHVAIVDRGRAGSEVRIGDGAKVWGAAPLPSTTDKETITMSDALRTVVVDGLSVQTTDQGATAINKLLKDLESSAAKLVDAGTAHKQAIAAKDEEIGTLKADLKKAQDAAPKPADLDKLVADRVALVTSAKAIHGDVKTDGVTDADIRKAVVTAKLGDEMVKDASEPEISGMFKALAKDAKPTDPVRDALKAQDRTINDANDNGQVAYEQRLADAWKPKKEA